MNYNYVAPFYDGLSRLCFLNNQQKAHGLILPYISDGMKILWLGGGSGWFLNDLEKLNISLEIDYVEISTVMIKTAKSRKLDRTKVNFIQQDILEFQPKYDYDLIITAFILDHFKEKDCQLIFNNINPFLIQNGLWFYVDFNQKQNLYQRVLTKSMILFFNILAGIKNQDFPKIEYLFDQLYMVQEKKYFGSYIVSRILQNRI